MANIIKKKTIMTIYVKDTATAEELKEVATYKKLGWLVKPCASKVSKEEVPHEVTADFNIGYDEVRKEDMVNYIKNILKDDKALKEFAVASHQTVKGEKSTTKSGKPKYNHIAAKRYFYKTHFPKKWAEIEKVLENRKFKTVAEKNRNAIEEELLELQK